MQHQSGDDSSGVVERLTRRLSDARRTRTRLPPLSSIAPWLDVGDAYAIAEQLHHEAVAAGAVPVGLKLGFTDRAAWPGLGVAAPFWSRIYDDTVTSESVVTIGDLAAPRMEPEIAVGVATELHRGASRADVRDAIGWAAVAVEIVQCRYDSWRVAPVDVIADGGLHARLILGSQIDAARFDVSALQDVYLAVGREGVECARGNASTALGGPVEALSWLLELPGVEALPAGCIVTTGSVAGALPIEQGEKWRVTAGGAIPFSPLDLHFV